LEVASLVAASLEVASLVAGSLEVALLEVAYRLRLHLLYL